MANGRAARCRRKTPPSKTCTRAAEYIVSSLQFATMVGDSFSERLLARNPSGAESFWLIIPPGIQIGSGGFLDWIRHVIAAINAYNYTTRS